jgi:hypothetical protein
MPFSAGTAVLLVAIGVGVGAFGTLIGAGGGFVLTRSCCSSTRTIPPRR